MSSFWNPQSGNPYGIIDLKLVHFWSKTAKAWSLRQNTNKHMHDPPAVAQAESSPNLLQTDKQTDKRTTTFRRQANGSGASRKNVPSGTWMRVGRFKVKLDYTRRARVAPLGTLVWKTFDVNLTWIMIFSSAKSWIFLFLHCAYGPTCEKSWFLGHIYFAKRFLFFLPKNLMWSRLHGIKSHFGFSTFHFLKFCLSIWTQKSCHGRCTPCMICQKIRTRTRTDGRTSIFKRLPHKSP